MPPVHAKPSWLPRVHGSEYGVPSTQVPLVHTCGTHVREPLVAQSANVHAPHASAPHCELSVQVGPGAVVLVVDAVVVLVVLEVPGVVEVVVASGAQSSFAAMGVTDLLPNWSFATMVGSVPFRHFTL